MQISFYHDLIALGSLRDNRILLWDYTMAKLSAMIKLPIGTEPTALAFVNGIGMLLVADSTLRIFGFKI
jgi:hypothetical protein